jgi:hypothetical protein
MKKVDNKKEAKGPAKSFDKKKFTNDRPGKQKLKNVYRKDEFKMIQNYKKVLKKEKNNDKKPVALHNFSKSSNSINNFNYKNSNNNYTKEKKPNKLQETFEKKKLEKELKRQVNFIKAQMNYSFF